METSVTSPWSWPQSGFTATAKLSTSRDDGEANPRGSRTIPEKFALRSYLQRSIQSAPIPVIDQTKNVGLITLTGAFVGMILGGASPVEAA